MVCVLPPIQSTLLTKLIFISHPFQLTTLEHTQRHGNGARDPYPYPYVESATFSPNHAHIPICFWANCQSGRSGHFELSSDHAICFLYPSPCPIPLPAINKLSHTLNWTIFLLEQATWMYTYKFKSTPPPMSEFGVMLTMVIYTRIIM